MNQFENWKSCAESPGFLTRKGNDWINPLGEVVVSIAKPAEPSNYRYWALLAYYAKGYDGELTYSLIAVAGDEGVGEYEEQLATVLKLNLPVNLDVEIYAFGNVDLVDSGEGSMYIYVGDTEIAELWVEPNGDYGFESDLLDKPSLDYLYDLVGSITDVNCPERTETGG